MHTKPQFQRNINVGQHFKFIKWKIFCHRLRGGQWILVYQFDCAIKWMRLYLYDFVREKAGEIHLSKLHCTVIQSNPTQIHSYSPQEILGSPFRPSTIQPNLLVLISKYFSQIRQNNLFQIILIHYKGVLF